jgi:hypothetical protein
MEKGKRQYNWKVPTDLRMRHYSYFEDYLRYIRSEEMDISEIGNVTNTG